MGEKNAFFYPAEGNGLADCLVNVRRIAMHEAAIVSTNQTLYRDLTERKRVTQILREELDLTTAILNTVSALVVVFDCEGYIVRFNRACEQITDYTFNEVKNQPFWDLFLAHDEKESVKAVFRKLLLDQLPSAHENYWVIKDGSRRRIAWSNAPLLDANGAVKYVIGTGIDITERQQAEETLRTLHEELELRVQERTTELAEANQRLQAEVAERQRTEEALRAEETRFRTLFEQSPLSMQILAPDGRTLQVNRAYEELWGATLTDIASYNLLEDRQLVDKGIMPYIQKAFAGETTVTSPILYDSKQVVPKGRARWAQSFNYPIKDEAGNIREVVLVHQDVTVLKQVEQVSRGQTEALTRTLNLLATEPDLHKFLGQVLAAIVEQLNTSMCALYFHDRATDTLSLHMTYHYGQVLTGGDQLRHPAASRPFPADLNAFWKVLVDTCRPLIINDIANDPLIKHHGWLLRNGVKMLLIVPLLLGKETIGFLGIRSTEPRRFTPDQIELAQALAQQATLAVQLTRLAEQGRQSAVLEERNRMAREIHDTLAQAFTGILLQVGVAKRIAKQQPEEAWSLIDRVGELAHEGLAEARRSVWALCPEALEYSDLANALARSVEQMTSSSDLRAQVCIQGAPRALPPEVGLNLLRIGQEALTNALRHAQAQEITIELTFEAQHVWLLVQDDGQGFEPHRQTDSGSFGLIGMRQRADRISGQLTIASQPGRGTEVVVKVPIAKTALTQGKHEPREQHPHPDRRRPSGSTYGLSLDAQV